VRTGRVGVANVVIRTRAHLAALYAVDNFLVLNTLRYATELRDPADLKVPESLEAAKVTEKELDMAERLVEDMRIEWDPAKFHDTYRDDLLKLIEQKAHGKVRAAPKAKAPRNAEVIDFAALLEKSLRGGKRAGTASRAAANDEEHAPRRKAPARAPKRKASRAGSHRKAA
jgi:DNA end-binding protein Ku